MTRFRKAVEEWRKKIDSIRMMEESVKELDTKGLSNPTGVILADVCRAVDAYERTIADLKKQNTKLRRSKK